MTKYSYEIVAGWDNSGTAVNIESISPSGAVDAWLVRDSAYYWVQALGGYFAPLVQTRGGLVIQNGFETVTWQLVVGSTQAYHYWYNTYQGKVTIRTRLAANDNAYSYKNAVLNPPPPSTLQTRYRGTMTYLIAPQIFTIYGTAS